MGAQALESASWLVRRRSHDLGRRCQPLGRVKTVNLAACVMDLEVGAPGVTSAMLSPDSEWVPAGTNEGQVRQLNR